MGLLFSGTWKGAFVNCKRCVRTLEISPEKYNQAFCWRQLNPEKTKSCGAKREDSFLLKLVMDGMGWDKKKAQLWFKTRNPLLADITPNGYEIWCGHKKLERFIRTQLEENLKPEKR